MSGKYDKVLEDKYAKKSSSFKNEPISNKEKSNEELTSMHGLESDIKKEI